MPAADLRGSLQVLQRPGLAADQVRPRLHAHERDVARLAFQQRLEGGRVHVALEGVGAVQVQRLGEKQLDDAPAVTLDMGAGGREVVVHRNDAALPDEGAGQDVLRRPSLMDGEQERLAEDILRHRPQTLEAHGPRVAVVRRHHRRQLSVAHGVDAAVRQHVQKDLVVLQQERVAARLPNGRNPLLHRHQRQLLDDAHLVHLEGKRRAAKEFYLSVQLENSLHDMICEIKIEIKKGPLPLNLVKSPLANLFWMSVPHVLQTTAPASSQRAWFRNSNTNPKEQGTNP